MNKCLKHNIDMVVDPSVLLLSNPPQPSYYCPKCAPHKNKSLSSGTTFTSALLGPSEVTLSYTIHLETGERFTLNPDINLLRASDVYKIALWKEFVNANLRLSGERYLEKAKELGITRHFELEEV